VSQVTPQKGRVSKAPDIRREELMVAGLSVKAITDRVGVAKGLFYHYFDSKMDLLNQIVDWQAEDFYARLPNHASEMDGDALDKIKTVISTAVGWKFGEARDMTITYMRVMWRDENLLLRTKLTKEYLIKLEELFAEIIAEGVSEGVCDVEAPSVAAELVFATWLGSSDRLVGMMLDLTDGDDSQIEPLMMRLRAWESAAERIMGIERGGLELYDYDYMEQVFTELAATSVPKTDADGINEKEAEKEETR